MDKMICNLDQGNYGIFLKYYPGDLLQKIESEAVVLGVILMRDGKPFTTAGLLIADMEDKNTNLEWFYVDERYRNQGIGNYLYEEFYWAINDLDADCTTYVVCQDDESRKFFYRRNFEFESSDVYKVFESRLVDMIALPAQKNNPGIMALNKIPSFVCRSFNDYLLNNPRIARGTRFPLVPEEYLEASMVYEENHQIKSIILVEEEGDAAVISYAYSEPGYELFLFKVIQETKKKLISTFGEDKIIRLTALNQESERLADKLFSKADIKNVSLGTRRI